MASTSSRTRSDVRSGPSPRAGRDRHEPAGRLRRRHLVRRLAAIGTMVMASVGVVASPAAGKPVTTGGGHATVVFDVPDRTLVGAGNPCGGVGTLTFVDQQLVVVERQDAAGNLHRRTLYRGRFVADPGGFSGRFVEILSFREGRSTTLVRVIGRNATNQIVVQITMHLREVDGELVAQPDRYETKCLR